MGELTLPDDPAEWPEDPFALLGLTTDCDKSALRKAYSRLIKDYKPEQFPTEFRKIRDAYEAVQSFLQFRASVGPWSSKSETHSTDVGGAGLTDSSSRQVPSAGPSQVLSAWDKARDGDEAGAYAQLRSALTESPGEEDICVRLYWLLLLNPGLDHGRTPLDWVDTSLQHGMWTRRIAGLLSQHARMRPSDAVGERYEKYLKLAVEPNHMLNILNCRWRAAGQLGHWQVVIQDLRAFRQRTVDQPHAWGQALVLAMDHVVWDTHPDAAQCQRMVKQEMAQLKDVELAFSDEFDRLEFLQELAAETRRLNSLSSEWRPLTQLLTQAANQSFEEVRRALLFFLQDKLQQQPPSILNYLLRLAKFSEPVFVGLSAIIKRVYANSSAMHQPDPDLAVLRQRFEMSSRGLNFADYETLRQDIFVFCVQEYVLPPAVAACLEFNQVPVDRGVSLADVIEGDEILLLSVLACNGFWSDPQPQIISEEETAEM